jgi:hypothetical protein
VFSRCSPGVHPAGTGCPILRHEPVARHVHTRLPLNREPLGLDGTIAAPNRTTRRTIPRRVR